MDSNTDKRSLMAGTAGAGPVLIIIWEVVKYYALWALQLYFYPLILVKRHLHGEQRPALRGSAVITGCDTGIGRAMALLLAEKGWNVFAGVLLPESQAELATVSTAITPLLMDVTDEASIKVAAERVSRAVGDDGLQLLINNAGVAHMQPVECMDLAAFKKTLDVNVTGVLAASQAFIPLLRRGQQEGRIINMGSVSGHLPMAFWSPYSSSKHALEGLTDCMRYELEGQGIKVVLIKPGPIKTSIWPSKELVKERASELLTTEDARREYGKDFTTMVYEVARAGTAALPVSEVVSVIYNAATCEDPKHRYFVGPTSEVMYRLKRMLPDELFSSILTILTRRYSRTMPASSATDGADGVTGNHTYGGAAISQASDQR
eukprot:GHUV01003361.1.p1 GENE.GHUV01003361.1~~GHUV01003361.1.p1  ORF type:complete len:376 (+),score=89.26 GHUV01003361.1:374-1501(+)